MPTVYSSDTSKLPKRSPHDFYITNSTLAYNSVASLLTRPHQYPHDGVATSWLDPGAGTGVWGQAIKKVYPRAHVTGVELRDVGKPSAGYDKWENGDFLTYQPGWKFTHIVGNPPYSHAEEFVRKGLEILAPGGQLLYLLNLSFLASQTRGKGLFKQEPPDRVYVCSRRASFQEDGKTAPEEYAMFRWTKY